MTLLGVAQTPLLEFYNRVTGDAGLPIIGEGFVLTATGTEPATDALERLGWEPLDLKAKEGLSLLNGTEGMLAQGCLAVHRARHLVDAADAEVEAALTNLRDVVSNGGNVMPPSIRAARASPGGGFARRWCRC